MKAELVMSREDKRIAIETAITIALVSRATNPFSLTVAQDMAAATTQTILGPDEPRFSELSGVDQLVESANRVLDIVGNHFRAKNEKKTE